MDKLKIDFLDVGQGDGIFIQCPDPDLNPDPNIRGAQILVDFGSIKNKKVAGNKSIKYLLKECGLKKLDLLVLTHGHTDHYNLVENLMNAYKNGLKEDGEEVVKGTGEELEIKEVIYGGCKGDYGKLIDNLLKRQVINTKGHSIFAGYKENLFEFGNVRIHMLASSNYKTTKDLNDDSIVLQVEYDKKKVMLCGDASGVIEKSIIDRCTKQNLKSDILKVAHHGSITASTEKWLNAVNPDYAIIMSDISKFHLPKKDTTENLFEKVICLGNEYKHNYVCFGLVILDPTNRKKRKATEMWQITDTDRALFTNIIGCCPKIDNSSTILGYKEQGVRYSISIVEGGGINVEREPKFENSGDLSWGYQTELNDGKIIERG